MIQDKTQDTYLTYSSTRLPIHPPNVHPFYTVMEGPYLTAVSKNYENMVERGYELDQTQETRRDKSSRNH